MRTNIVIDDDLMSNAMEAAGVKTKREAVELGLSILIQMRRQAAVRQYRGKLAWSGDLEAMKVDK